MKTFQPHNSIFDSFNIIKIPLHALNMLESILETYPFIKKHKIWKGFFENKWVAVVTIIVSILFSYWLISDLFSVNNLDVSDLSEQGASVKEGMRDASKGEAISSGSKYLLLILLEVIIFHFSVKTLSILTGQHQDVNFKQFLGAEKRMIKLLAISFFKGAIASLIIWIILSLMGIGYLSSFIMFFVYSYFMGYAFIDNYNEQFSISINDSLLKVRQHVGAATLLGVVVSGLIYIPVLGPFLAPLFGAIAATLYSHKYQVHKVLTPVD